MAAGPTVRPAEISRIVKKRTTPTASLKSDSPAICTSSCFGARAVRSMPMTAMGSVGEMMAPKSTHSWRSRGRPQTRATSSVNPPTMAVEMATPTVASTATSAFSPRSAARSTSRAPANSSSDSIPSSNVSRKFTCATSRRAKSWTGEPSAPAATSASEATSAQTVTPMVAGRPPNPSIEGVENGRGDRHREQRNQMHDRLTLVANTIDGPLTLRRSSRSARRSWRDSTLRRRCA